MKPGLIVVIGSGELGPSMASTYRSLFARTGATSITMLDSPYGFQENADDLSARISSHFMDTFGVRVEMASLRKVDATALEKERMLAAIRKAEVVFAGPGSPSYALRVWAGLEVREAFLGVIDRGGALVMASAAALTLGLKTIPVYEIYKVGDDLHWLDGLDVLSEFGVNAVVVPHWNNREGGFHDTSHCFIGEARFRKLMALLPGQPGVLGVDEHTSVTIDPEAGAMTVQGVGSAHFNGTDFTTNHPLMAPARQPTSPPLEIVIDEAHDDRDELISALVDVRSRARERGDYAESDRIRDVLARLDVELGDDRDGTSWHRRGR